MGPQGRFLRVIVSRGQELSFLRVWGSSGLRGKGFLKATVSRSTRAKEVFERVNSISCFLGVGFAR